MEMFEVGYSRENGSLKSDDMPAPTLIINVNMGTTNIEYHLFHPLPFDFEKKLEREGEQHIKKREVFGNTIFNESERKVGR